MSQMRGVYDHDVEGGFFFSLFDHDLAESVILDCPIDENLCVKANDRICDGRAEVGLRCYSHTIYIINEPCCAASTPYLISS